MRCITTNRDLYRFVADLKEKHSENAISLESYLANLRDLAASRRCQPALPLGDFARLLDSAFTSAHAETEPVGPVSEGFRCWDSRIREQIRDLHDLDETGALANEYRYFGVDAPSGARWYNFDPLTFLECAAEGTFGGWQGGDETGRAYVPGPVAVIDANGKMTTADPRDIDAPVVALPDISWDTFVDFLEGGQWYE